MIFEMELKENESLEDLQCKGLKIIQNKKWFCFGMDSVLISNFSKNVKEGSTIIDLGAGTGIISILLAGKTDNTKIKCVEKQVEMADLITRNIQLNHLENRLEVINDDILNIEKSIKSASIDVVVTNPPYKQKNTGIENKNKQKYISKFETTATLNEFIKISKYVLKDKGQLFMVHRPDRLVDIITTLRKYKIEPKRLQFVYSHKNSNQNAKLVLIEAIKNANPFLKVEKNIYVYDKNGEYTDQIKKIYKNKL